MLREELHEQLAVASGAEGSDCAGASGKQRVRFPSRDSAKVFTHSTTRRLSALWEDRRGNRRMEP